MDVNHVIFEFTEAWQIKSVCCLSEEDNEFAIGHQEALILCKFDFNEVALKMEKHLEGHSIAFVEQTKPSILLV
jgi:hypothetical protein